MKTKQFRSQTGKAVHIALLSGHAIIIPAKEWIDVPEMFWMEAFSRGCIAKDAFESIMAEELQAEKPKEVQMLSNTMSRRDKIERVILGWMESNELVAHLNSKDKINAKDVTAEVGFLATTAECEAVYARIQQQLLASEKSK